MVRRYNPFDYHIVKEWWEKHKWPPIPPECLPKTGFIVEGLCAGFLYQTDSKFCWLEWVISNPESDKKLRDTALNSLLSALIDEAKSLGYELIMTSTSNEQWIKRLSGAGFNITESSMTNLIRRL